MLERLSISHRSMEESAGRLAQLLDADTPDTPALADARWDIGARIMQHMALEDRHLFGNLARHPRPEVVALAERFQSDYAQHVAHYAEHAKAWTAERVAADWDRYRIATREQLDLLAQRIERVERELFPLAAEVEIDLAQDPSRSWTRDAFAIKDSIAVGR